MDNKSSNLTKNKKFMSEIILFEVTPSYEVPLIIHEEYGQCMVFTLKEKSLGSNPLSSYTCTRLN